MCKKITRLFLVLLSAVIVLLAVMVAKTALHPFPKPPSAAAALTEFSNTPANLSLQRLAGGLRLPTISNLAHSDITPNPFDEFKAYLQSVYPGIYRVMETETVNDYGLIFRWPGVDPQLKPILIISHYDVAFVPGQDNPWANYHDEPVFRPQDEPLPPITEMQNDWDFPAFSGAVANGRIYGRGTLDDKGQFFAILEAADALIARGFTPARDIWFAFGHDEEIGGQNGALTMAQTLCERGLRFDTVYDEGGAVTGLDIIAPKSTRPVALVGVGEKGFVMVKITVYGPGGHSSMPPAKGSLVLAAELIEKLNANQMPATLIEPMQAFFNNVGPEMGYPIRMAIANQWLLKPLMLNFMGKVPAANALVRTTTAISMVKASEAPNVLTPTTEIGINYRLLPGDTVEDVVGHVTEICRGYQTDIEVFGADRPASRLSPTHVRGYEILAESMPRIYPDAIVSPYITIGATDAYKYEMVSDNVYRLMPALLNRYELALMHGNNEYISIRNYGAMINFYKYLMENY